MFLFRNITLCLVSFFTTMQIAAAARTQQKTRLSLKQLLIKREQLAGALEARTSSIIVHSLARCQCGGVEIDIKNNAEDLKESDALREEYWKRKIALERKKSARYRKIELCGYFLIGTMVVGLVISWITETVRERTQKIAGAEPAKVLKKVDILQGNESI